MRFKTKLILLIIFKLGFFNISFADNHSLNEILEPFNGDKIGIVNPSLHEGVIGIGKTIYKEQRAKEWKSLGYNLTTLIHPLAYIDPRVEIGEGSSIWPFAFIDGDTKIGENTMIGAHSMVHYGTIGDNCHITMGVKILPRSILKDNVFLGVGATILEGIVVGKGSAVGANFTVSKNIPDRHLYIGSREKPLKKLEKGVYYPLTTDEKSKYS